jgi:hypothetical protein
MSEASLETFNFIFPQTHQLEFAGMEGGRANT